MKHYFGAHIHIDTLEDITDAIKIMKSSGGNLIQMFMPDNLDIDNIRLLKKYGKTVQDNDIYLIIHSSYKYNIANEWDGNSYWIEHILNEIKFAYYIGARSVVIHFGKYKDLEIGIAINNMFSALVYIHKKTIQYSKVNILLETTAGQGTELCYHLEDLATFYNKIKYIDKSLKDRIKLCIDTCHVFSAGYDLTTQSNIKLFLDTFDELVGIKYVYLLHLNDSKVTCGSRKDRHENIGNGNIGFSGLKILYEYFKKLNVPIVLETPTFGFVKEITLLKESKHIIL